MQVRGADTIARPGSQNANPVTQAPLFYQSLESTLWRARRGDHSRIHGMETGIMAAISWAITSVVLGDYDADIRLPGRSDFFAPHAIGALQLVDTGAISAVLKGQTRRAAGHTISLPGNALRYGRDGNGGPCRRSTTRPDGWPPRRNFLAPKRLATLCGLPRKGRPTVNVIKTMNGGWRLSKRPSPSWQAASYGLNPRPIRIPDTTQRARLLLQAPRFNSKWAKYLAEGILPFRAPSHGQMSSTHPLHWPRSLACPFSGQLCPRSRTNTSWMVKSRPRRFSGRRRMHAALIG